MLVPGRNIASRHHLFFSRSGVKHSERGETLIEIICSVVLIGAVVAAIFANYSTATRASSTQRNLVTADVILRRYAESLQAAVQKDCATATTFTTTTTSLPPHFSAAPVLPLGSTCPSATSLEVATVNVVTPNGRTRSVQTELRSP
jgi:type II secretory pathway pseudopilin PulG